MGKDGRAAAILSMILLYRRKIGQVGNTVFMGWGTLEYVLENGVKSRITKLFTLIFRMIWGGWAEKHTHTINFIPYYVSKPMYNHINDEFIMIKGVKTDAESFQR